MSTGKQTFSAGELASEILSFSSHFNRQFWIYQFFPQVCFVSTKLKFSFQIKINANTHITVYFTKKQHQKWWKKIWYIQNWSLTCDEQDIDMKKKTDLFSGNRGIKSPTSSYQKHPNQLFLNPKLWYFIFSALYYCDRDFWKLFQFQKNLYTFQVKCWILVVKL